MMIGMISQAATDRCVSLPFQLQEIPVIREAQVLSPAVTVCFPVGELFGRSLTMVIQEAVCALAARGAAAGCISIKALMPEDAREEDIRELFREAAAYCADHKLCVYSPEALADSALKTPVVCVSAAGKRFPEAEGHFPPEHFHIRVADPGTQLVMAGTAGSAGAARLAGIYRRALRKRFLPSFIDGAAAFRADENAPRAARISCSFDPQLMMSVGEGGIFRGLWMAAQEMGAGFDLDLHRIPIRQETIEICEWLDLNPYQLYDAGTLLVVTDRGEELCGELLDQGIKAAVLGRMINRNARILTSGDEARYLEKPQQDMLWVQQARRAAEVKEQELKRAEREAERAQRNASRAGSEADRGYLLQTDRTGDERT